MKEILSALKTIIPAGISSIKDIAVLSDPDILPPTVQFPFVGLKDGSMRRSEGMNESVDETLSVDIYIYVQLLQDAEASIMGVDNVAPVADIKGLLELAADLVTLLDHNLLDNIVESAFCSEVMASETMIAEGDIFIQRKGCRYTYERS
jgi:hypothetical protein